MKLTELMNHRVSYQVIVTFDLDGADPSEYRKIRNELAEELELESIVHLSKEDGGGTKDIPYNTLAALYEKDSDEKETRKYFEKGLEKIFKKKSLKGKYLVIVAQNWSVASNEFNF